MKILHTGMCATGLSNINGQQLAFINNSDYYEELNCGIPNYNAELVKKASQTKFDIIFMQIQTPNIITEETAKFLKSTGAFVVNFTGDVRHPIPQWYYDIGQHINLTLFSNYSDVRTFSSNGYKAEYLDIGYDPTIFKPDYSHHKDLDIVFMGNNYNGMFPLSQFRVDMVNELKNHFGNRFHLFGNGWSNANGSYNHSQKEENEIYQRTKIAINCSHFDYSQYSSDRMLRIMGSGVLCMCKNYPDIDIKFTDEINLVVWDDFKDLIKKCEYYLDNEVERKIISKAGQEHINRIGTFNNMAINLISLYAKYK